MTLSCIVFPDASKMPTLKYNWLSNIVANIELNTYYIYTLWQRLQVFDWSRHFNAID